MKVELEKTARRLTDRFYRILGITDHEYYDGLYQDILQELLNASVPAEKKTPLELSVFNINGEIKFYPKGEGIVVEYGKNERVEKLGDISFPLDKLSMQTIKEIEREIKILYHKKEIADIWGFLDISYYTQKRIDDLEERLRKCNT